jgi:hypothetical protein
MSDKREIVASYEAGRDGDQIEPYQPTRELELGGSPETDDQAEQQGPDENAKFWNDQINAAMIYERRWRAEAEECEMLYFGEDNDPGSKSSDESNMNRITDKVALIHGTIDVLRPLLFSETPQPVVRRRFRGDGKTDETDLMVAEAGQRIAEYLLDTTDFDDAMAAARDDWLIAGRGSCRAYYKATMKDAEPEIAGADDPDALEEEPREAAQVKASEEVKVGPTEWRRFLIAAGHGWNQAPWIAFETPMTRTKVIERFGQEKADAMAFNDKGLSGQSRAPGDDEKNNNLMGDDTDSGAQNNNPFDTANVWEIWNRESGEVIWWCKECPELLDKSEDPLGLEHFFPTPKPLLATTKGQQMTPRPDIRYYERRANEIDLASKKMKTILDALSVSGLFPGTMQTEVKKLLDGTNQMIPVSDWIKLMDKGGSGNIIQWLPLQHMITAIQALAQLREGAKQAMFEASGVSDIMRAQGDPNETATAQQIKGRYAGLRLQDRQRKMALFARDMLRIMVEIAVEHFDTTTLADITGIPLPMSEMEREMMRMEQEMATAQHGEIMQMYQLAEQMVQEGAMQGPLPPPPPEPKFERIPETSWELVHQRLKDDFRRKISVTIETQSTILADEQADKEARIEFLGAFSQFVSQVAPLAGNGQFDFKTIKELLMFGVRGFPKSRTLESLISSMPEEPQGEPPEDTAVTVAKIRGEIDKMIKEMDMANDEADRAHQLKLKGADMMGKAADIATQIDTPPQMQTA